MMMEFNRAKLRKNKRRSIDKGLMIDFDQPVDCPDDACGNLLLRHDTAPTLPSRSNFILWPGCKFSLRSLGITLLVGSVVFLKQPSEPDNYTTMFIENARSIASTTLRRLSAYAYNISERNDHGSDGEDIVSYHDLVLNFTRDLDIAMAGTDSIRHSCLIHVGKTAGSMVRCVLDLDVPSCPKSSPAAMEYESIRRHSKLGHLFSKKSPYRWGTPFVRHIRDDYCKVETTDLLVATTRDPVSRIKSAFNYERCDLSNPACLKATGLLYLDCYSEFEELAMGVDEFYKSLNITGGSSTAATMTKLPDKPSEMTCPQRAWSYLSGSRLFWANNHHWYNYEYYFNILLQYAGTCWGVNSSLIAEDPLLEPIDMVRRISSHIVGGEIANNQTKKMKKCPRVMTIRQEYLARDWDRIETILGGNSGIGKDLFNRTRINNAENHITANSSTAAIAIPHETHLEAVCRALCLEIQYYKLTLWLSVNLDREDIDDSIGKLRRACPAEPVGLRRCHTSSPTLEPARSSLRNKNESVVSGANGSAGSAGIGLGKPRWEGATGKIT